MKTREILSKIFLEMEADIGTRDLATEVLFALGHAIQDLRLQDDKQFDAQFHDLLMAVKNTQPRFGLIVDDFYQIWQGLEQEKKHLEKENPAPFERYLRLKNLMLQKLEEIRNHDQSDKKQLLGIGKNEIEPKDVILLHSHSQTVLDILKHASKKKKFSCIVAEQEYGKTQQIIHTLNQANISFCVVPEYMLSHVEERVNKVFLGGVTINSFHHVVGDAGTMAVVSEFHKKVPIYLFLTTSKCSFWDAGSLHHSFKENQVRSHIYKTFCYKRIKYSHDRIPLEMFDFVVTEKKKFSSQEMLSWYKEEFKKRAVWRKTFIQDGK